MMDWTCSSYVKDNKSLKNWALGKTEDNINYQL